MRVLFFLLLLGNLVLLLVLQGSRDRGLEPERLAQQLHADRLSVVDGRRPPLEAPLPADAPAPADPPAPAAQPPGPAAQAPAFGGAPVCVEIGDFSPQAAVAFEDALSRLSHTGIPQRRTVRAAPSQLVYLAPLPGEVAATRRLAELRALGFADSAVIRDDPARRWGISLGLFSRPELAEAQLAKLREAGVSDARIGDHPSNAARYAYRLPGVDAAGGARLAAAASNFEGVALRRCQ